ncbi:MAG: CHASE2 domain-containing protein [Cyanobacteriota bacterium]|nr:CHASE2 domain-containing protein [Cyanobacteriota bacterium]
MGKLVILKLGEGEFQQGFPVILQISDDNVRPSLEITGKLPPNPEIAKDYYQWQSIYRSFKLPSRVKGLPKHITQTSSLEEFQEKIDEFIASFNIWLTADSFRPICEKLLEKLTPEDDIRILIQTKNFQLQKMPWHLWDLLERYPKAEIALSAPNYEQIDKNQISNDKVKILAILGHSEGIDTQADRKILEKLPNADISFLVEPQRKDINDTLWQHNWQILFFAGHSITQMNATGKIYINQTESLTIAELRYALKKALKRGLQLAIFNSCDGLGLAREFADLNIPQIIVMREPVPDKVAQEFLKYFLEAFAAGESLYIAVKEARERLQGLENQYPCATWLPIIYQNPAEIPVYWQDLYSSNSNISSNINSNTNTNSTTNSNINKNRNTNNISTSDTEFGHKSAKKKLSLLLTIPTSIVITALLMGIRYLGILQPFELKAFDQLMQLRPSEIPDSRLLVVTVTEEDVRSQSEKPPGVSLSDKSLSQVLEKLESYQPAAIGLDIYRDYAVDNNYPKLTKQMQDSRFVAVCQANSPNGKLGVAPPPEVDSKNLGFSDIQLDNDNIVRRHYLALTPPSGSDCNASYALNVQLALRYLYKKGIKLQFPKDRAWQLGKLKFKPLEAHTGGYQGIDALGHQILLNYRSSPSPELIAPKITLGEVLAGKLNEKDVKGKVVIIGTTAESFKDYALTPYTVGGKLQNIPGVVLQAQMTSQLISAALDERALISSWELGGELLWVWGWALTGGLTAWYLRKPIYLVLAVGVGIIILYGSSLILLTSYGWWVPLVPAIIAFGSTTVVCKTVNSEQLTVNS